MKGDGTVMRIRIIALILIISVLFTGEGNSKSGEEINNLLLNKESFKNLLMSAQWEKISEVMQKNETWTADPRGALLAAHINLLTNSYNKATFIFNSVIKNSDLLLWEEWTHDLTRIIHKK